jgi:predicted transcriptional regulator|tara:strand:- start:4167 stop:4421 length:255 start_codon:yes stop_codon:yes gene_type:complete
MICKERVHKAISEQPGLICKEYSKILKARSGDVREALNLLQYHGRVSASLDRKSRTYKWHTKEQGANSLSGKLVRQIWNGDIVL